MKIRSNTDVIRLNLSQFLNHNYNSLSDVLIYVLNKIDEVKLINENIPSHTLINVNCIKNNDINIVIEPNELKYKCIIT